MIARAREGDTAAFEALVVHHARYVYNLALRTVQDPQEAEDIAQESFIRAWRGLPRFRGEAKFSTWIYRIVTNLCYNRLPGIKRQMLEITLEEEALQLPDPDQEADAGLLDEETRQQLYQAVDQLPEGYRLLIALRYSQGLSYKDIAEVTEMPLGTVKTGLYRAHRQLEERLRQAEVRNV